VTNIDDLAQPSAVEQGRRAFRQQRHRRGALVSFVSTLAFAVVAWFALVSSPGWPRVQQSFFDLATAQSVVPQIIHGLWLNLRVLAYSSIGVLVFGLALALLRTLRAPIFTPVRLLVRAYVDLFRGMPLIIVLYLVGFGIPGLRLEWLGRVPAEVLGTVALILTYSAYVAEVFRAGIEAVHPSQRLAARSLGLTYAQSMRLVVLPQAFRKVAPPLMNDFVSLQKDVGLISVLGAVDAVRSAQIEVSHFANFTPYVVAGLCFVLLAVPTVRLADWFTARLAKREQAGGVL
jgi:polar amino acid transport system permease protein